ncbi:SGNH/GDSL hydrolase family protein [Fluviispira multicolorata]|uniref:Phospholipase/lecithinase/hemolysin n=1 Tax=Fluviispira multicolorata TaxID=2654512 RepID=A0A833JHZ9_9BACT|nr:SGNH/GDSL hydrolase family protein [Fluviispira multicolorata]KAB8033632.1 hypothetical protein GCL57_02685 [Fluviispira multicolorata]
MKYFVLIMTFVFLPISAFAEEYFVACYYYDTITDENSENPSLMEPSKVYIGASSNYYWALNQKSLDKLTLAGIIKDGFFIEKILSRNDIVNGCERAIEKGLLLWPSKKSFKLYDFKASKSNFHAYEYPIRFIKDNSKDSKIKQIVIFGDSLSDTGNLKKWTKVIPYYPYWYGRFSNGFIWNDYFAKASEIPILNFAYGGAKTAGANEILIKSLSDRVDAKVAKLVSGSSRLEISDYLNNYLTINSYKTKTRKIFNPKETLYIIWIGANDYVAEFEFKKITDLFLKEKNNDKKINAILKKTINNIISQIMSLNRKGAYNFLVLNIPDLGKSPAVLSAKYSKYNNEIKDREEYSEKLSSLIYNHNLTLIEEIDKLKVKLKSKINLIHFDISKMFDNYINNKNFLDNKEFNYGFSILDSNISIKESGGKFIQNQCYTGSYTKISILASITNESMYKNSLQYICRNTNNEVIKNTIFWDSPHPTSFSHCWISYVIQTKLEELGIIKKSTKNIDEYREYCLKGEI